MRIVAGKFSSRKLKTLEGTSTRPTLDKVKEAVFSSLGGFFDGGTFLDLYAGSGAIGLEAISRGVDHAYFVERLFPASKIIHENIHLLHCENQSTVLKMSAIQALEEFSSQGLKFDFVYLDPPYALQENEKIMRILEEKSLLNEYAKVIVESLKEDCFPNQIGNLINYKEAIYGITKITYYKRSTL